jgi:hypothetical protein
MPELIRAEKAHPDSKPIPSCPVCKKSQWKFKTKEEEAQFWKRYK